jgi:hypothetical protein
MNKLDLHFELGNFCISYASIRVSRMRIVKGKNGFIQIGKFAFIWGIK